ncbi:MAG: efflux RND transporter periplasmic adaptor subunit, partial [bacterium]
MSKKVILPIVILITAIGLMSALSSMKKPPEKKVENKKAPLVEVAPLLIKDEPILITSQGTVTPVTQSTLVAEVSGRIVQTSEQFGAGNLFTKNEILLQIDPADYQVALKRAQASLAGAEAKLAQEIA